MNKHEMPIGAVGQMTLPIEIRSRWQVQGGMTKIKLADLQEGVLLIPGGKEWEIIEAYYPESELVERAKVISDHFERGQDKGPFLRAPIQIFHPRKISTSGQATIMTKVRDRWRIRNGGIVDIHDLNSGAIVTQSNETSQRNLQKIVPADLFEHRDWEEKSWTHFLDVAYYDWLEQRGKQWLDKIRSGNPFTERPIAKETILAEKIELTIVNDTLESALRIGKSEI